MLSWAVPPSEAHAQAPAPEKAVTPLHAVERLRSAMLSRNAIDTKQLPRNSALARRSMATNSAAWTSRAARTDEQPMREPKLVDVGPNHRAWTTVIAGTADLSTNAPTAQTRAAALHCGQGSTPKVVEIGSGMNYWNGERYVPSEPTFELTEDGFRASRVQLRLIDDATQDYANAHVSPGVLVNIQNPIFLLNNTFGGPNGSIRTRKFHYSFAAKGKLTSLGRLELMSHSMLSNEELTAAYKKRAIPLSQVDTNAAWAAMQPYLRAGIMDVERLNRECRFELSHLEWAKLHVPIYYAVWTRNGEDVARIKLLMPDKILLYTAS